jgi:hypothetical protein
VSPDQSGNEKALLPVVYGTSIDGEIDLGPGLPGSRDAVWALRLVLEDDMPRDLPHRARLATVHGRKLWLSGEHEPGTHHPGCHWVFDVADVVSFSWASGEAVVGARAGPEGTPDRVRFWFIHVFLPLYLTLEEKVDFIHAGAVLVDDEAIAFVAPSTGGKSTLTAHFLARGHQLVTDDKLATSFSGERLMAVPAHGALRPYRQTEDLGFQATARALTPAPVRAFYVLEPALPSDEVGFRELRGLEKFRSLLPGYLVGFPLLRKRCMDYLARVVNSLPVFEVDVPRDLTRLDDVYTEIIRHVRCGRVAQENGRATAGSTDENELRSDPPQGMVQPRRD